MLCISGFRNVPQSEITSGRVSTASGMRLQGDRFITHRFKLCNLSGRFELVAHIPRCGVAHVTAETRARAELDHRVVQGRAIALADKETADPVTHRLGDAAMP